jgi:peroxiredoxin
VVASPLMVGADKVADAARELAGRPRGLATKPMTESKLERNGIAPGTQAPEFTLPDLDGGQLSLGEYAGKRRLLVFSDPHCEPCMQLAPTLAERARTSVLSILMVSRGDLDDNREKRDRYRLPFPVGLQRSWEVSRRYGIFSTPVAFLIDEEGQIARQVAIGQDAILDLVEQESAVPREEVSIEGT